MHGNCLISNAQFPQQQQSNKYISDLPKESENSDIIAIRNLLETQEINAIQHFLVIYRN